MGAEVVGSEMAHTPVETVTEADNNLVHEKENEKTDEESVISEPIRFGSLVEEPIKGEGDDAADANFPKDAVDEWPAPRQIHSFYFARLRPYDDPKIKAKIDQADKEIQKSNQTRFQIMEELKAKRADRAELIGQVKALKNETSQYKKILNEKRKEMEPLQEALGKLRNNNSGICSSEEELNDHIYSLQYRIQHESIPLTEEKQILREIKQLEGTREKVIANAAMRAKIQDSLGQKDAIQDQVKLMGVDMDGVKKENKAIWERIVSLEGKVKALDGEINSLQKELTAVTQKRDKAFANIQELRKQRDEGNGHFYNSRRVLGTAKQFAANKDLTALEDLANTEAEKFMSLWCNDQAFRDDYEKRLLPSLDSRQLSRDGRMRNPDEKPLVVLETPALDEPEPVAKPSAKRPKEEAKSALQKETVRTQKAQKEASKANQKTAPERVDVSDEEIFVIETVPKKLSPEDEEVDETKMKERKRQEEIAKAKQAKERKMKLAEKAAAKAALRAQKEAEKKLKDREKKLKKKSAEEPAEAVEEVAEPVNVEEKDEVPTPVPVKGKTRKVNSFRHRSRAKGADALPKAILRKRNKANYYMWAAYGAAVAVLLLLVLGYLHFFSKQAHKGVEIN